MYIFDVGETAPAGGGVTETLAQRTSRILSAPDCLDVACSHVANGGSLTDLCKAWGIRYSDLAKWIAASPDRVKEYELAKEMREEWTVQALLEQLKAITQMDIRDAYNEWGEFKSIHEMGPGVAASVKSVKTIEHVDEDADVCVKCHAKIPYARTLEVTFHPKDKMVELLGKTVRMFVDRVDATSDGKPIQVITGVPRPDAESRRLEVPDLPSEN